MNPSTPIIHVLLAEDDVDDRYFFNKALKTVPFIVNLDIVEEGEELMTFLNGNSDNLPDVLFLDQNMPRQNGFECLVEIRRSPLLKDLPVIIYSTYLADDVADKFYEVGAHYYFRKTTLKELEKILQHIFTMISENRLIKPSREKFVVLE
ncbi:MAG: response regulator [Chryseolinea sp.]